MVDLYLARSVSNSTHLLFVLWYNSIPKKKVSKSFHLFVIFSWKSLIFFKNVTISDTQTDTQTEGHVFFSSLTIINKTHVNILIHRHIVSETQTDRQLKCIIDIYIYIYICIYIYYTIELSVCVSLTLCLCIKMLTWVFFMMVKDLKKHVLLSVCLCVCLSVCLSEIVK